VGSEAGALGLGLGFDVNAPGNAGAFTSNRAKRRLSV
jgi:hypothetical protein